MWQTWRSRSQVEEEEEAEMALSGPLSPTLSYMHLSVLVSPSVYLHLWRLCGATAVAAVNGFICKAVSRTWLNLAKIETTNPQSDSTKGNKKKKKSKADQGKRELKVLGRVKGEEGAGSQLCWVTAAFGQLSLHECWDLILFTHNNSGNNNNQRQL